MMKVKDLIAALQNQDPEAILYAYSESNEDWTELTLVQSKEEYLKVLQERFPEEGFIAETLFPYCKGGKPDDLTNYVLLRGL